MNKVWQKKLKNEGNAASSCCSPGVGGFHHKKVSAVPATKSDTPGKNSESDSEQLFRQISPQIFAQNAPKFASTLFQFSPDISLLPYIKI